MTMRNKPTSDQHFIIKQENCSIYIKFEQVNVKAERRPRPHLPLEPRRQGLGLFVEVVFQLQRVHHTDNERHTAAGLASHSSSLKSDLN